MVGKTSGSERTYVIEFWDVGGHRNYQDARSVFYNNINGIILVHDLTNKKSLLHLKNWLDELVREDTERKAKGHRGIEENYYDAKLSGAAGTFAIAHRPILHATTKGMMPSSSSIDSRTGNGGGALFGGLPILVVGNKTDLCRSIPTSSFEHRFEYLHTNTIDMDVSEEKFASFFNRVIERRFHA